MINLSFQESKIINLIEKQCKTIPKCWCIPRIEGIYLYNLLLELQPHKILELGTSIGYSTIFLGLAASKYGGKILTVDHNNKKIKRALNNIKKANLQSTINVINGDSYKVLKSLDNYLFDFIFIDHGKKFYLRDVKFLLAKLKSGIICADNAINHADQLAEYLSYVRSNFDSTLIEIGNGLEITKIQYI
jgi:predicted O-methyltransferase YrrM